MEPFDTFTREWPQVANARSSVASLVGASVVVTFTVAAFLFNAALSSKDSEIGNLNSRIANLEADKATAQSRIAGLQSQVTAITQDRDNSRQQLSSLPKPPAYVNPLHDELEKWHVVSQIRNAILTGSLSPLCRVIINRLQETYPEELAKDVKKILDTIGWTYEERFADNTVEKEVSIWGVAHGPGHSCAAAFSNAVRDAAKTRNGGQLGGGVSGYSDDSPTYLKQCGPNCFGIDVGNEEPKTP